MNTYCSDYGNTYDDPCKFTPKFGTKIVVEEGGGGNISSPDITTIRVLDQADYDALTPEERSDTKVLYCIRG